MNDSTTPQTVLFPDLFGKPLTVAFDQPRTSSDGGAVLLRAAPPLLAFCGTAFRLCAFVLFGHIAASLTSTSIPPAFLPATLCDFKSYAKILPLKLHTPRK